MYCMSCGREATVGARFCAGCGTRLVAISEPHPATASTSDEPSSTPTVVMTPRPPDPARTDTGATTPSRRLTGASVSTGEQWRPTREQFRVDALHLGLVLSALVLLCFIIVVVASLSIDGASRGLMDWVHLTAMLTGLVFHGTVSGSVRISGSSGAAHLSIAPLTLTLCALIAIARVTQRAERVEPSRDWRQALSRVIIWGLGTGVVGVLGSLLSHTSVAGLSAVDLHLTVLSSFLTSTLLVGASSAWGRLRTGLLPSAAAIRVATMTRTVYAVLIVIGLGAALAVVGACLAAVLDGSDGSQTSSSAQDFSSSGALTILVLLLGFAANLLVVGAGVVAGVPVQGQALVSRSWSLFSDGVPWGYTLLPVALLLIAVLVGAYAGLREDPREPWWMSLARWGVVSAVTWLILTWLSGSFAGARVSTDLFGIGTVGSDAVSLSLTTGIVFLVSIMLGVALFVGTRFALPELAGAFPGAVTRASRRRVHPVWGLRLADAAVRRGETPPAWLMDLADAAAHENVRPLPSSRRRIALAGTVTLGCLVLLVAAVAGVRLLRTTVYGPAATVEDYLNALAGARGPDALAQLTTHQSSPLLTPSVLSAEVKRDPISDIATTVESTSGGTATVRATYRQGDHRVSRELTVTTGHGGHLLGLFPKWLIDDGALETLTVSTDQTRTVTVEGVTLTDDTATVFPGRLQVTSPGDLVIADASQLADLRDQGGTSTVELPTTVRDSVEQAVTKKVTTMLSTCAKSTSLSPEGCPFSTYAYEPSNVKWSLKGSPSIELSDPMDGAVSFSGTATMHVTYLEPGIFGPAEEESEDVAVYLNGEARDESDRLVVSVD